MNSPRASSHRNKHRFRRVCLDSVCLLYFWTFSLLCCITIRLVYTILRLRLRLSLSYFKLSFCFKKITCHLPLNNYLETFLSDTILVQLTCIIIVNSQGDSWLGSWQCKPKLDPGFSAFDAIIHQETWCLIVLNPSLLSKLCRIKAEGRRLALTLCKLR